MLHAEDLCFLRHDGAPLFSELFLHLPSARHALVGANGIGKSVLARLLAGELVPQRGQVRRPERLGFYRQFSPPIATVADALGLADRLAALAAIERGEVDVRHYEVLGEDWGVAQRAAAALDELGLAVPLEQSFASLSGGQQTRLRLWRLFEAGLDYLILDEPGNHLDPQGRHWLQQRLQRFTGGVLLISHDRRLLEEVVTIHELSGLGLRSYGGGYLAYRQQKALELAAAAQQLDAAAKALRIAERRQQQSRERAQQREQQGRQLRASGSQSSLLLDMRKQGAGDHLGRLRSQQQQQQQRLQQTLNAAQQELARIRPQSLQLLDDGQRCPLVLQLDGLQLAYGSRATIQLQIRRGDKWQLAGPNGCGKSSLLRLIASDTDQGGRIRRHGRLAWLDQQLALGDEQASALAILGAHQPDWSEQALRASLAQIGLRAAEAERPLTLLSGGERLKLALQCCQGASLLLLDEPDNHLDLDSRALLETALRAFTGAVLLVSHDAQFIQDAGVQQCYTMTPA